MTVLKSWTVDEMFAEHPCPEHTHERIAELWAGRWLNRRHRLETYKDYD